MRDRTKTPSHAFHSRESGLAAVEVALLLPFLLLVLLVLVEGANAMHVYSSLKEASREGARLVLRQGESGDMDGLMQALLQELPGGAGEAEITTTQGEGIVTIEVSYAYQSFYGYNPALEALGEGPLVLRAQTTMPVP